MALTLWTGNAVYLHLSVAFIQMLKASDSRRRRRGGLTLARGKARVARAPAPIVCPSPPLQRRTLRTALMVYFARAISIPQAFTPVITMIVLYAAGLDQPSQTVIASVLAIAVGTAISSYGA